MIFDCSFHVVRMNKELKHLITARIRGSAEQPF